VHDVWIALGLTTFAGMATGIGSAIAFTVKRTNYRFLSVATGFSAGVMLYVSFVEILPSGLEMLAPRFGDAWGTWVSAAGFFTGLALMGVIDNLVPARENPHETRGAAEMAPLRGAEPGRAGDAASPITAPPAAGDHRYSIERGRLLRVGLFTALAIAIHNFPEGLATFLSALEDPALGLAIALAIALHNIPEGVSVSVPIYYATGDRRKAFVYSLLSGLCEPLGAVIAYLVLLTLVAGDMSAFPSHVVGMMFTVVAGIMVYISVDELLPTSCAYGKRHDSLLGFIGGMAVMALGLLLAM
jgi:ZIP family zinc transporter